MKSQLGPLVRIEVCDSTNLKARELRSEGAELGTVIVSNSQTAGRGRGKRAWHSPKGGLYLSILVSPNPGRRATDLTILAGIAINQAVKEFLPKSMEVSLKWPNDVLLNRKKVGGILCEGDSRASIVGIGINVNIPAEDLAEFQGKPFKATSFSIESGGTPYDLEEVLSCSLRKFETILDVYRTEGFGPMIYLWEKNCRMVGKRIELRDPNPLEERVSRESPATLGVLLGIDDGGGLVLSNAKGERSVYYTGEITCFWP